MMKRLTFFRQSAAALLLLGLLTFPAHAAPNDPKKWEKDIAAFETSDATNPPPKNAILFIGSSSIRRWTNLVSDFPKFQVINRGFGGSQIEDSVYYAERIALPYQPRLIVLYAGGNDLAAGKSPEQVCEDYKAFVKKIHAQLPNTRIAFVSSAPNPKRWALIDKIKALNQLVEAYTKQNPKLDFLNVYPLMLGEDGLPKPDIFVADKLHMNPKGYAIWIPVITEYLAKHAGKP